MSYLAVYQGSIAGTQRDSTQQVQPKAIQPNQARYRFQRLRFDVAQEILHSLENVQAIDLSHNDIDAFPLYISENLIALDISFNLIERPIATHSTYHLVELNLSNNSITE